MVTRDDIHLDTFPAESCCNCGFLSKFVCDAGTGEHERNHVPITTDFERFHGLGEHDEAVWQGRRLARPQCWMRKGFLEREANDGTPSQAAGTLAAIHMDRSESAGDDYCPQFTPWVPHFSFEQHWEERKLYLLERDRRAWEDRTAADRRAWEQQTAKWPNRLIWAAAILAVAEVITAILVLPAITRWLGLD